VTKGRSKKHRRRSQSRETTSLAERAPVRSTRAAAPPWYAAEGERGQRLLEQGRTGEASEIFEAILERLPEAPSYGQAAILDRLGRCLHLSGEPLAALSRFGEALDLTARLPPSPGVRSLRGVVQCERGDALRVLGRHDEARTAYLGALKTAEQLRDVRAQVVDLGQLGALEIDEGRLDAALHRYRAALRLALPLHEPRLEAPARSQIARLHHRLGQPDEADAHYRAAIELDRKTGDAARLVRNLTGLADLLQSRPEGLSEARALAEEALATAQALDPAGGAVWRLYGLLASIAEREAAALPVQGQRAALEAQARDYRELERRAPLIAGALASLRDEPTQGRAVLLGQLARCLALSRRVDLALGVIRAALESLGDVTPSATVSGLRGTLLSELGNSLRAVGRHADAQEAYQASLEIAEELRDLRGQAIGLTELCALEMAEGRVESARGRYRAAAQLLEQLDDPAVEAAARAQLEALSEREREAWQAEPRGRDSARRAGELDVTIRDDVATDYGFEPDLLVDGRRESRIVRWAGRPEPLAADRYPVLTPGARSWTDDDGAVRFRLPAGEPTDESDGGCVILRRTRRDVLINGRTRVVSRLVEAMDGAATVGEIVGALAASDREPAERILAVLTEAGAIDVSGRAVGRYLHGATKKGVLPAGGLGGEEVLQLATDTTYRGEPDAPRLALREVVPGRLQALHEVTRSRRSQRDYTGRAIAREQFDAMLHTACGVTGAIEWEGRQLRLRAYPSSGGLYAVEVYPVVFRVDDLGPAVYRYRADEHALETVRPDIDQRSFVRAALPMERKMVAGTAAMLCLVGFFPRHERKYGEGGYRMLVAEAGHLSQNLVLAATALGLSARPFGGVFDHLLNRELGVDEAKEAFLLAVLVGHAKAKPGGSPQPER
jgi:SagB-type dehydrogenase family enzyme